MKSPSITVLKKYLQAISKSKAKYITTERLSKIVGVYPEVIAQNLSFFNPMITMDPSYNIKELIPDIQAYINEIEEKKTPVVHQEAITRKVLDNFESIHDFLYKKMSIGGIIDKNAYLDDKDLRILKKLITEEQLRRKSKK